MLNLERWADKWLVAFAPEKTKSLIISNKKDSHKNPSLIFKGKIIEEVSAHTYLGVLFTGNLSWNKHIHLVEMKARKKLNMLQPLKYKLDRKSLDIMFHSFVSSSMYYAVEVWGGSYDSHLLKLEQIVVDGMRLVTGATARSNIVRLYDDTNWQSFSQHRDNTMLKMLFKMKNQLAPNYLNELLPDENQQYNEYNLRNGKNLKLPITKRESLKRSFIPTAITLWNSTPINIRQSSSLTEFKTRLRNADLTKIHYFYGKRWPAILHARLRIGCSKLNYDLCYNLHLPDINPSCLCGAKHETSKHFLMHCELYSEIRAVLKRKVESITKYDFITLLTGSEDLSLEENRLVFDAVHEYILETQRFD